MDSVYNLMSLDICMRCEVITTMKVRSTTLETKLCAICKNEVEKIVNRRRTAREEECPENIKNQFQPVKSRL